MFLPCKIFTNLYNFLTGEGNITIAGLHSAIKVVYCNHKRADVII